MSSSLLLLDPRNIDAADNARLALGMVEKCQANPLFVEEFFAEYIPSIERDTATTMTALHIVNRLRNRFFMLYFDSLAHFCISGG